MRNYGSVTKYYHDIKGYNSRLDPLQAALLGVKLRRLDRDNAARARAAAVYQKELGSVPGLMLQRVPKSCRAVWHVFTVRTARRDALAAHLAKRGIATLIHYPVAPHRSGAFKKEFSGKRFPIAERMAATLLSLPMHPNLTTGQARAVARAVASFCR